MVLIYFSSEYGYKTAVLRPRQNNPSQGDWMFTSKKSNTCNWILILNQTQNWW